MLVISTSAGDLARVHPWLDDVTRTLPKPKIHGMHVALEEAVMNIAMHSDSTELSLRLELSPEAAALVVEDTGPEFNPAEAPIVQQRAEPGGWGLTLLRHYCRDIRYQRVGARNRLTLRFPLQAAPEPAVDR